MPRFIEYISFSGVTLTTSTPGTAQPNTARSEVPEITVDVVVAGAVTGTTPTLAFNLMVSVDGVNFALVSATTPNITAAGTYRFIFKDIYEPTIRLDAVVGGTTPSFGGVTVYLLTSGTEDA